MSTHTAIATPHALKLGTVIVDLHGLWSDGEYAGDPSLAIGFGSTHAAGLKAGFHASTAEMRQLAAEIIRHADITDAAARVGEP